MEKGKNFFSCDAGKLIERLGREALLDSFEKMLLIRSFETRAEACYQQGKIGGFFHAYTGQEAIQTAALRIFGPDHWYIATYRVHALALLLGATPEEIMAELYGKKNGNAKGRGGSMHLYTERLMGGFGIVGGHLPIATGAAFAIKYRGTEGKLALCFLGEGAVAQGAFHEALNLASLWDLPCLFVIENNRWGMGTAVEKALCVEKLAEEIAPAYRMKSCTLDGMDFFQCAAGFEWIYKEMLATGRPMLVEALTERFRGHSISDPGTYRSKEQVKQAMRRDPILLMKERLKEEGLLDEEGFKELEKKARHIASEAARHAEESPWPDPAELEEDVLI